MPAAPLTPPAAAPAPAAGAWGKLPQRGDFVTRGLAPPVTRALDDWLGPAMAGARAALGEGWRELYLTAPVWRFLLGAGSVPGRAAGGAIAGVLCPSADRVGRLYPLVVAGPLAGGDAPDAPGLEGWLDAAEDLAVAVVEERNAAEAFLDAVSGLEAPALPPAPAEAVALDAGLAPRALAAAVAPGPAGLWWRAAAPGDEGPAPGFLAPSGLPSASRFAAMLADGRLAPEPAP